MIPAYTGSPVSFSTGIASPVIAACSTKERRLSTTPSTGMRPPGFTPWLAMCSVLAFVSLPTDDDPAARFISRAARSTASRSRESHPPSSAGPTSAAHPADHASVSGSRLPESSPDDAPGTRSRTLPVVPKTPAWLRWLRCPPPNLPRQRRTLAPHCLHGSVSFRRVRPFPCRPWQWTVALHVDRILESSSRPPSSRAFWLDTVKSTRVVARPTSLCHQVWLFGSMSATTWVLPSGRAVPVVQAQVTLLPELSGGRRLLTTGQYRPHIVIGPQAQRVSIRSGNVCTEKYLGVMFVGGPETMSPGKSAEVSLALMYS